jgi:hypothetical protein
MPPDLFVAVVLGYFWDRVSQTIWPGWLWTTILLIAASWVARIQAWATDVQPSSPFCFSYFPSRGTLFSGWVWTSVLLFMPPINGCIAPHPAFLLRWSLANILPGLYPNVILLALSPE